MSQTNDRSWVDKLFQWPRIPLGLRLFLLYVVVVALTTYVISSTVMREIKPTVRQVSEETLVDMANLLATLAAPHLQQDTLSGSEFAELLSHFGQRAPNAAIWGVDKSSINHRIYITDADGIVLVDSWQRDVGADFSRWNPAITNSKATLFRRCAPYGQPVCFLCYQNRLPCTRVRIVDIKFDPANGAGRAALSKMGYIEWPSSRPVVGVETATVTATGV